MTTARTLYRNTLIAAALAAGSLGLLPVAEAHDHGWRDRDDARGWYERDGDRGWRGDRGWHRGRARRADGERLYRDGGPAYDPPRYPPVYFRPGPPRDGRDWDGDVSVVIRVPF
jgi:hypothetical protein